MFANQRFRFVISCCLCIAVAVLMSVSDEIRVDAAEGGTLYGIDRFRTLVEIDLENREIIEIGEIEFPVNSLTYHPPTGELFGIGTVDEDRKLVSINRNTGLGSVVGSIGVNLPFKLAYNPTTGGFHSIVRENTIGAQSSLIEIDATTGAAATVGETGYLGFGGLAYDSQDNLLFGTATPTDGAPPTELVVVDPVTGIATALGPIDFSPDGSPRGLTYEPFSDQLLVSLPGFADPMGLFNVNQAIFGIDKQTGEVVSSTFFTRNDRIGSLAFVPNTIPEPASTCVLTIGSAAAFLRRRRQSISD